MPRLTIARVFWLSYFTAWVFAALWLSSLERSRSVTQLHCMSVDTPDDWPPFVGGAGEGPWVEDDGGNAREVRL